MSGRCDVEVGHFSLTRLSLTQGDGKGRLSAADPDLLARAVRAHKEGDALAQAALTLALMLAIGAVAFVLSASHAAAASELIVNGVWDHSALLIALAAIGSALLIARRAARRLSPARIHDRRPPAR